MENQKQKTATQEVIESKNKTRNKTELDIKIEKYIASNKDKFLDEDKFKKTCIELATNFQIGALKEYISGYRVGSIAHMEDTVNGKVISVSRDKLIEMMLNDNLK